MKMSFKNRMAYAGVRCMTAGCHLLPLSLASWVGRTIGRGLYHADRKHRDLILTHLRIGFGHELPDERLHAIAREVYPSIFAGVAEFARIGELTKENVDAHVNWNGILDPIHDGHADGRGLLYATGHMGNWELCGAAFCLKGVLHGAIAKPLHNPLIDQYIVNLRRMAGMEIWEKSGALRFVLRALREGKGVGMLVDQAAGAAGLQIPFFGLPASTLPTIADLAIRGRTPILTGGLFRDGKRPMQFIAHHGSLIRPNPDAPYEEERIRILTQINADFEYLIRQAPEQWLWMHRRWKVAIPRH